MCNHLLINLIWQKTEDRSEARTHDFLYLPFHNGRYKFSFSLINLLKFHIFFFFSVLDIPSCISINYWLFTLNTCSLNISSIEEVVFFFGTVQCIKLISYHLSVLLVLRATHHQLISLNSSRNKGKYSNVNVSFPIKT